MAYDIIIGRNEADRKLFGNKGVVFLGRSYVKMGRTVSLSNNLYMDMVRSHIVYVAGKRGGGKSYTLGVIAEGVADLPPEIKNNIAVVMLDTMGIYWTMKHKNEKDADLLEMWGLEPKGLDVKIFTPVGYYNEYKERGIPTDAPFSIRADELTAEDWALSFGITTGDPVGIAIEKTLGDFREAGKKDYTVEDMIDAVKSDGSFESSTKNETVNRLRTATRWGLFSSEGTRIDTLIKGGQVTVLDISCYATGEGGWGVKSLVVGLVAMKLFVERMISRKEEELEAIKVGYSYFQVAEEAKSVNRKPLVWLVVDECLPYDSEVITENAHTPIGEIIKRHSAGERFKVLGYDPKTGNYGYHDVKNVFKKEKRHLMSLVTETGKKIKCTPNHSLLTRNGFLSAVSTDEIGAPVFQYYATEKDCVRARLLGHLFGDGYLSGNGTAVGFSGKGDDKDLEKIKKDLERLGFSSSKVYSRVTQSEIKNHEGKTAYVKGLSQEVHSSTRSYRLFKELGAIAGEKALKPSKLPRWIKEAPDKVKAEFLAALFGSDGTRMSPSKKYSTDFNPVRFSFNKIKQLESEAYGFANEIKWLLESLGIGIGKIGKRPGNIRKDGNETIKIVITIRKKTGNMICFLEKVGYRYCSKKERAGIEWLAYLKTKSKVRENTEKLREEAIRLHKEEGLGKIRIGRKLGLPDYRIREWIYYNKNAGIPLSFPSFKDWVKDRVCNNVLYEKIIEHKFLPPEHTYDIEVDNVHNFVAQGCIVHNCHEFLPKEGKTAATDALVTILREGRQPGISLILATQQPGKIHGDVTTQSDIVISHRITAKSDVEALNSMTQSYLESAITGYLNNLPSETGAAIILDDNSERIYPMRVRPRFSWHGGEAPTALKIKKSLNLGL